MDIHDDSGWLVGANTQGTVDIDAADLEKLLQLADLEDQWAENVKNEVRDYDNNPRGSGMELLIHQFRVMNTGGTVVQYPFGYICTFPSRRHLFRGERRDYDRSEASLLRRCRDKAGKKLAPKEIEILHVISNMRIVQFRKFIWQFDIIPQWEGKLSDVNYKALAQHYGFETFLLDLTNNVRDALFFATCKWVNDHYEPLTQKDIDASDQSRFGVIYHSPDWVLDFMNGDSIFRLCDSLEKEKNRSWSSVIDTGLWDGVAYQIGLQPFYRAHTQCGYVYPMKTLEDIRCSGRFERMRFRQTVEFSRRMYDLMDGGNKVYPEEGIVAVDSVLQKMQTALVFSENDLLCVYDRDEANKEMFPDISDLRRELESEETAALLRNVYDVEERLIIQAEEVSYPISEEVRAYINRQYNDKPFLASVGGMMHVTREAREYRRNRYYQIYGEYPEE